MKLKKLNLSPVEFFEMLVKSEVTMYSKNDPKITSHNYFYIDTGGQLTERSTDSELPIKNMDEPRTVWIKQEWYEEIPDQGVLCNFSGTKNNMIACIVGCEEGNAVDENDSEYSLDYLTPLTPEEIKAFLPAEPVTECSGSSWAENEWVTFPVKCHTSQNHPDCKGLGDSVRLIESHDGNAWPFVDSIGNTWKYAIPVDE